VTLTAEQLLDYRQQAGDDSDDPLLTDAQIQGFYTKALTFSEDEDTTEARIIVYMLRRMLGHAAKLIDPGGEIQTEKLSQFFDHIKEMMLPYWEGRAGMQGGGTLSTGSLNLDIDFTEDDL